MTARVGLISDTHGLLRPEVGDLFKGVQLILHAGDIGRFEILRELSKIATVLAVRGNNDKDLWAAEIPEFIATRVGSVGIHMVHDCKGLAPIQPGAGVHVVVSGHSHLPSVTKRDGVLFVNPGSAGPRRFKLPVTVAVLTIDGTAVEAEIKLLRMP